MKYLPTILPREESPIDSKSEDRDRNKVKTRASVKKICDKCKIIKRKGVVRVICVNKRHKQRQG